MSSSSPTGKLSMLFCSHKMGIDFSLARETHLRPVAYLFLEDGCLLNLVKLVYGMLILANFIVCSSCLESRQYVSHCLVTMRLLQLEPDYGAEWWAASY